ncbi:variant erythrocyte surface antigen-1 family protein [Babesia caballi]|uniref:Variant erythrocyte surface antigen-1 family protein n=1 Tax=Babesia caballi TaxID=5871 RepID=A0AAV4LPU8_BABCB|nr:variant erythrocyte surface antigen-1 family protein [Babesia caballi]
MLRPIDHKGDDVSPYPFIPLSRLLFDCPSNLKEAIDWILRVTGKDGQDSGGAGDSVAIKALSNAVTQLLNNVKASSDELNETLSKIKEALDSGGSSANGLIGALGDGLKGFRDGIHINGSGASSENVYQALSSLSNLNSQVPQAPEIFMGCVPLCFYGLSYLYWRCHTNGGGWSKMYPQGDRTNGYDLKYFMESAGYDLDKDLNKSKNGVAIATALTGSNKFQELSNASHFDSFADFLRDLIKQSDPTKHSLYSLQIIASAYFLHKRLTNPNTSPNPPSSIRTMLYWLSGLLVSPNFGDLLEHLDSLFPDGPMPVAISGSEAKNDALTSGDLAGHLITSCISSFQVLRSIQGRSVSDDPLLHYIYCNSEFSYPPSGAGLFNALSAYTYALQFQLSFLYRQCSTGITTCGWWLCNFGRSVQAHEKSHICPLKCQNGGNAGCRHDGKTPNQQCNHFEMCGTNTGSASPLQAFLTDNLKGFSLPQQSVPASPTHLDNHPAGAMCHVEMGFKGHLTQDQRKGSAIYSALKVFSGNAKTPLRQLSEKLSCLTKRTPRTLGDIFGFYLQMIGQLFNTRMTPVDLAGSILLYLDSSIRCNTLPSDAASALTAIDKNLAGGIAPPQNSSGHTLSLLSLYKEFPFWFQIFMVPDSIAIPSALFDLRQHCHNKKEGDSGTDLHFSPDRKNKCNHSGSNPADLWSLYYPGCTGSDCGKYLTPLCHSIGCTFAPRYAITYLSWVLYLTDDFHEWLFEFVSAFKNITCKSTSEIHNTPNCACPSVVQCGGVLPLLYRHGFQFMEAKDLKINRKTYAKFSQQLSNIIAENAPLHNLLLAIDEFLYYVRFRFMSLVSSFWLCSLLVLLYFILYGIDVWHFKSHAHLPSSHSVPPIALLTTGKAPALTKLTYYMP